MADTSALAIVKCSFCSRVIHLDAQGAWRDNVNLMKCDADPGNHCP